MMQLRWILITLIVILNTINIKASETGEYGSQDVSFPTKASEPEDPLKASKPGQPQRSELEKKRRETAEPEAEKKKTLEDDEQYSHFLLAESQYHAKENLDKYIYMEEKYADSRIQVAIEALNKIINDMDDWVKPGEELIFRKSVLDSTFNVLSRDLNTVSALPSFIQEIKKSLAKAISEEERQSNHDAYSTVYVQLMEYCIRLRSMLEEKLKPSAQEDKLEDSDVKSTMDRLIKKNALLDPKLVAEELHRVIKFHSIYKADDQFCHAANSFRLAKLSIKKFWERVLDMKFWEESNETHKTLLKTCWFKKEINPAFEFILNIFTMGVMRSSELGIPIIKCAEALKAYMGQIENAFWHLYASEITNFDTHYLLTLEDITEHVIIFIRLQPNKKTAIDAVKESVIDKPSDIIKAAFGHSEDGVVNQKTLNSLKDSVNVLYERLKKDYGSEMNSFGIRVIYTNFLSHSLMI